MPDSYLDAVPVLVYVIGFAFVAGVGWLLVKKGDWW